MYLLRFWWHLLEDYVDFQHLGGLDSTQIPVIFIYTFMFSPSTSPPISPGTRSIASKSFDSTSNVCVAKPVEYSALPVALPLALPVALPPLNKPNTENGGSAVLSSSLMQSSTTSDSSVMCPKCSFLNHSLIPSCEICEAPLGGKSLHSEPAILNLSMLLKNLFIRVHFHYYCVNTTKINYKLYFNNPLETQGIARRCCAFCWRSRVGNGGRVSCGCIVK